MKKNLKKNSKLKVEEQVVLQILKFSYESSILPSEIIIPHPTNNGQLINIRIEDLLCVAKKSLGISDAWYEFLKTRNAPRTSKRPRMDSK